MLAIIMAERKASAVLLFLVHLYIVVFYMAFIIRLLFLQLI